MGIASGGRSVLNCAMRTGGTSSEKFECLLTNYLLVALAFTLAVFPENVENYAASAPFDHVHVVDPRTSVDADARSVLEDVENPHVTPAICFPRFLTTTPRGSLDKTRCTLVVDPLPSSSR